MPLPKRVGVCDTAFYYVLHRQPFYIGITCTFQSFTHIAQNIIRTVKHTVINVTEVLEAADWRRYTQRRKGGTFVRLIVSIHWYIA